MSISRLSLNFCFWRLLMMENAMAMVSSCMRRLVSTRGISSPLMRSTGCDPTFRWRSEAFRSDAIFKRSLMCISPSPPRRRLGRGLDRALGGRGRRRAGLPKEREPPELVRYPAFDHAAEGPLQGLGDRPPGASADRDLVHRADGRNLGCRPGEEQLVRHVK